ncbi:MAG: ribosome silencing factor [Bacteroidales bacterium]|nr:ribosome silencing factor [Bacteroidales bacterium]
MSGHIRAVITEIAEKKGKDIVSIDLSAIDGAFCSAFVICSGDSSTQVNAIADGIERGLREKFSLHPWSVQGRDNSQWILLDYGDVVVHVFHPYISEYYRLEALWADGDLSRYDGNGDLQNQSTTNGNE